MTDNEKLIKELRTWAALIGSEPRGARDVFNRAADALAVFEKAHAPTDDELWEVARQTFSKHYGETANKTGDVRCACGEWTTGAEERQKHRWAKVVHAVAAGFRRPVSPAPSACDHDWHNRVSGGSLCSKCNLWQDKRVPELPADPSDAQVLAGLNASERSSFVRRGVPRAFGAAPDLSYYSVENAADMRAALRAAFAVTEQGENRGEQNR